MPIPPSPKAVYQAAGVYSWQSTQARRCFAGAIAWASSDMSETGAADGE